MDAAQPEPDWEKEEQELGLYVPYCLKVIRSLISDGK